jgi:hypothetical protein
MRLLNARRSLVYSTENGPELDPIPRTFFCSLTMNFAPRAGSGVDRRQTTMPS